MSIYNCQAQANHWNTIITREGEDGIVIHTQTSSV